MNLASSLSQISATAHCLFIHRVGGGYCTPWARKHRIVGISGFTTRPVRARKEKPKISGFSTARIDKILAVKPDLVLAFSDLQGDICRDLVKAGIAVHHFNQRSVAEILAMIATVGNLVGAQDRAAQLVAKLEAQIAAVRAAAATLPRRPRVYFEEWDEPMISGIQWVSELITLAGGDDIFAELAQKRSAKERIIAEKSALVIRQPDIVFASWCGKKFQPTRFFERFSGLDFSALASGEVHEIKSAHILSPGPAAIEMGLPQIAQIIQAWAQKA
jgi:iron complex transport system substrate-binding protein